MTRTALAAPDPVSHCWKCGHPDPDLAHYVMEFVAAKLAEPLRLALDSHLDEHGCGTGNYKDPRYIGGFSHCPTAEALWDLLPDGDRILLA